MVNSSAIDLALAIVERRQDEGLAKEAVVELVLGPLVVTVHPDLQSGNQLLADARVEIVGPFGFDRIVLIRSPTAFEVLSNAVTSLDGTFSSGGGVKYRA